MDGIAFNWIASDLCGAAVGWVRPRRSLARLDILAAFVALLGSFLFLSRYPEQYHTARASHLLFQVLIGGFVFILLRRDGQYSSNRRMARVADIGFVIKNVTMAFFFVAGVWLTTDGFFTGFRQESRLIVFSGVLILAGVLMFNRLVLAWYQRRLFTHGRGMRGVIVVGQGKVAAELADGLQERPWLGVQVVGTVPANRKGFSVERIQRMLHNGTACDIVLALDPEERGDFDRVTQQLNLSGLSFSVVPSLFEESLRAARIYGCRERPVVNVDVDQLDQVERALKRSLDLVLSALAVAVISPLLLAIAIAVKIDSDGPVVFRQTRLGYAGKPFEILKFRTMVVNADRQLEALKSQDESNGGPHFKMSHDPRITRVGAFLRKWSLDELPQFINVLRGDMSLVGPRPPLPREVQQYETAALVRLRGKPGITGLWQVSGRKDLHFEEMVNLDRQYLDNWSLGMDLSILKRTVSVVLARKGAY
jgi:exopolysaccharide biosynthesis polyprenyl glycosylphosphotransferase